MGAAAAADRANLYVQRSGNGHRRLDFDARAVSRWSQYRGGRVTSILVGMAAVGGILLPVIQGWIGGGHSGGMVMTLAASLVMVGALIAMRSGWSERIAVRQGGPT